MPVLLRATGAGSRQPPSAHRQSQQQAAAAAALARRTSQLSVTPSVGTTQTVLQVNPQGVRRTITSSTTQQSIKAQTLIEKFRSAYKRFQLKRLFPLFFILIYMFIGAILFWLIESGEDERRATETMKRYHLERELLWRRIDEIIVENKAMKEGMKRHVRKKEVITAIEYFQKAVDFKPKAGYGWDFMSSMYFAGTLFTTIGYGDIACVTVLGRIATVVYSLVGIPLMLITLNELGKFLYSNITGCVKSIDNAYLGILGIFKRPAAHDEVDMVERGGDIPEVSSLASELGSQRDMQDFDDDPKARMSVKVAVGITFGWIFFCAALFKLWEDWSYGESIYFMYISLSTIGLGDLSVARRDMMVLCFVFVIVGLSLVSMCINVVQVALEDFYCQLMMKLIMEYQQKLAEGGGELGASAGMLKLWGNNKAAKFLMPLLSKEAKKEAMVRVEVEAKKQGIEVPPILQDLDDKTGMPKLLHIVEDKENKDQPPALLEEMVQKVQLQQEEAAMLPELFIAHEAQVQTDSIQSQSEYQQTEEKEIIEGGTQTDDNTSVFFMEAETQTVESKEVGQSAETQTSKLETFDKDTATISVPTVDTEFQTDMINTSEEEVQTWIAELSDAQTGTEIETKNVRIQTPSPVIEMKTVQTDNLESRKSPSKMSSAKKKLRRAFAKPMKTSATPSPAMSEWKEVDEEAIEEEEQEEAELEHEEGSVESLHWDPVDGMHAEKQLPVSRLTELFNKNSQELRRRTSDGSRRPSSFTKKNSMTASPRSSRARKVSE